MLVNTAIRPFVVVWCFF